MCLAVPGKIISIKGKKALADFSGVNQEISVDFIKVKKNDYVLTTGGIYGTVLSAKDNEVTLKIDDSNNTKVRLARSAIIGVEKSSGVSDVSDK